MKISSIILTALVAGTAGVIAGTLFAPVKGSKTRGRIAKKGQEYKEYVQNNFDDLADSVSHPFENLEDETMRLGKKALAKTKIIKAEVKQQLN
ncbi:YtxH domain-containing protein [Rhodohalobacter sp. 8-1]|uniref:YtxH domain-containing protein n=1 Tax=Rhodohalobacter sp. 8-1 TaxID=3131972 RepID=UPI0030EF5EF1